MSEISVVEIVVTDDTAPSVVEVRIPGIQGPAGPPGPQSVPFAREINSGDGLTGGGDLSADRTLAVDATVVRTTREVATSGGLTGGGDLSGNRTLSIADGGVTLAKLATDARAAGNHTYDNATSGLSATNVQAAIDEVYEDAVPPGASMLFNMQTPPSGWLKENGAAVSRTAYSRLFAAIGTTFGAGDGSTTFGLPDSRGEFDRNWDDGRGVDSGRVFGSAQSEEIGPHNHPMLYSTSYGYGATTGGPGVGYPAVAGSGAGSTANGVNNSGAETRPRNIARLRCIKY